MSCEHETILILNLPRCGKMTFTSDAHYGCTSFALAILSNLTYSLLAVDMEGGEMVHTH